MSVLGWLARLPLWKLVPAPPPLAAVIAGASSALAASSSSSSSGAPPAGPTPTLRLGSSGEAVRRWQAVLGLEQTGAFDASVDAATRAWQRAHALKDDGVVGPKSWATALGTPLPASPAAQASHAVANEGPAPPVQPSPGNAFGLADGVAAREQQILSYAAQGLVNPDLVPLTWSKNGHSITVLVTRRALAIADASGRLMFSMSFAGAQQLLDQMGLILLTTRVADEVWRQGTKLTPTNRNWNLVNPSLHEADGSGGKTFRMIEQSAAVEAKVAEAGNSGAIANEGKDWVNTRRFWPPPAGTGQETPQGTKSSRHNAANFGLYMTGPGWSKSPGGENVIQSIGLAHERSFDDYSQLVRGMLPVVTVDGQSMRAADVLADPALSYLLNDEGGTLPATRHPDL